MSSDPEPMIVDSVEGESSATEPRSAHSSGNDGDEDSTSADATSFEDDNDRVATKEGDADADVDEPKKKAKRKSRGPRSTAFSKSVIRKIVDSAYSGIPIDDECSMIFNKCLEIFIRRYTIISTGVAGKEDTFDVNYDHLAQAVRTHKSEYYTLRDVVPRKKTFGSIKGFIMNQREEP